MQKFIFGIFLVMKEHRTAMLFKEMYISRLMTNVEQIEGEMLKEIRVNDSKRAYYESGFTKSRSIDGNGHFQ